MVSTGRRYEVTDDEWERIKPYLPKTREGSRGRPAADSRKMLNGICWILRSGAAWRDLPERYGPWQTVYKRFVKWQKQKSSKRSLRIWHWMRICRISASTAPVSKLIKQVQVQKNKIDDGSQNLQNPDESREKYEQNQCIGITRGGRNTKIHAVVDGIGYPIHIQLSSGNISDVSIAQEV